MFAKSFKTTIISTLAAALALAFVATEASAIAVPPSTYYPASMCQLGGTNTNMYYSALGLQNAASSWGSAVCPIPNTWSGRIGWASVKAIDQNPNSNVQCTIYVLDNTQVGFTGWWETKSTSGAANAVQELSYGSIGTNAANHYFSMFCWVPGTSSNNARSMLKSYYIFEN
jgi:hypothetical protein